MIEGTSRDRPATGYVPGKSLTLVRNPSWDRSTDPLRGAFVDRIEISDLVGPAEKDGGLGLLREGKLDVGLDADLSPGDLQKTRGEAALASRLHVGAATNLRWIPMNIAQ